VKSSLVSIFFFGLPIVGTLGLFVSLSACSGVKGADDSQARIDQSIRQSIDQTVAQAKLDSAKTGQQNSSVTDVDKTKDVASAGGQPGAISVSGALVIHQNSKLELDNHISTATQAGLSWRGSRPLVESSAFILKAALSDATKGEIEKQKLDRSFINIGCNKLLVGRLTADLEEKNLPAISVDIEILEAHSIFICDASRLSSSLISITGATVILSKVTLELVGTVAQRGLSIVADELQIEGENTISSDGVDGEITIVDGPNISIGANKVAGEGALKLLASGANYKASGKTADGKNRQ